MNETTPPRMLETTPEAVAEARTLLAAARQAALATLDADGGHPMATRVAIAMLDGGAPVALISDLSAHSAALRADPRCSLLIGDIGKGDPLAHPRLTLKCRAMPLPRTPELRSLFLSAHPKAELYVDLQDFVFVKFAPEAATFIAGFGRAFRMTAAELLGR